MTHQVHVNADGIVLPDGNEYDDGDTATLTDAEFGRVRPELFTSSKLTDLGGTPDGGGGGFHDGQVLYWVTLAAGLADGINTSPVTQDGTSVYGADGTDLLDIAGSSLTSGGIPAGDDFILQRSGADVVYFKTTGLYVATIQVGAIAGLFGQLSYASSHPAHGAGWQGTTDAEAGANGVITFAVGAMDVAAPGLASGATLASHIFNHSGSPQDVGVTLSVMRVV